MDSKTYWANREAEALKHRITDEKEYDKEIKRIYSEMLDNIQKEIDGFYGRYASKEGISIAEAKKRVTQADIKAYERKAKKYVKEKDFSDKANEEMRLYNLTMKVNRLELLKANIGLETIAGHNELEKFLSGILKDRTMDELKRQAGILGKSLGNNEKAAHAIVNASFHNGTFSDRIWQYQDLMRYDLGKELQTALVQGKNPRAIGKTLRGYWYGNDPKTGGGAVYCMERLMRTELARVQTEAQKQSFNRNGFEMFTFLANHGCCPICSGLNGKHFRVSKMMPGENAPPMHPNCRCSVSAYEDSAEYEAWLDYLSKGGTTSEWNKLKNTKTYEGAPKSWGKINTAEEKKDLKVINPNYKSSTSIFASDEELAYNKNCVNCVVAYDLRQRGHDVEALSFLDCDVRRKTDKLWTDSAKRKKRGNITGLEELAQSTDGYARYFVGYSEGLNSHAVIAEIESGKLKVIDAQRAKEYNKLEEISNLIKGEIEYWRIDDLEVTQTAYNACKRR